MKKKKTIILRLITGILAISFMVLIFSFSAQNGEQSSGTSGRIVNWMIENIFQPILGTNEGAMAWLYENLGFLVRKLAHFSIYAALGMSLTGFFFTFEKLTKKKQILLTILIGFIYATTDELHQLFTADRSGQITDVMLDTVGVIAGTGIIALGCYLVTKRSKKKEE